MMSSEKVDSQGAIVDEIQKAQEEYLSALSHETAIDKRYLKSLYRRKFSFSKGKFFREFLCIATGESGCTHMRSSCYYLL